MNKRVAKLNWQTATEVNNYGFEVERKLINSDWTKISFVNGHGNSNSQKSYSFEDEILRLVKFTTD
jgi:creatinine amidohydrolase/Fe(II)-dependent formamide hydrolase-like protein